MNFLDIAAVVGAMAWIPVVIDWICKILRKPLLLFIMDKNPEIGYTTYGSILNYKMAMTVKNGPIVITKMEMKLSHESGDTHLLTWQGMLKNYGSMTIENKKFPMENDQVALAIKVSDCDVEDGFFRFQDASFNRDKDLLYKKFVERKSKIKSRNIEYQQELLSSDELYQLDEHLRHAMFWKTGKYFAELKVETLSFVNINGNKFEFLLSAYDIEQLNNNKDEFKKVKHNEIYAKTEGYESLEQFWNWVYPAVTRY